MGGPMYEEGRRLYTEEINAAVRGAKAGGATEIVVVDCHGAGGGWTFNSLFPSCWTRMRVGRPPPWTGYTASGAGLRRRPDGRHARAGRHADGVLCHTVSGQAWRNLWFNDELVGETGINAGALRPLGLPRAAGHRRRGDCREARLLGDGLTTVP